MAKTNQIKKVVNGEIADADDINQIVEDAGAEGGSIPYDPITDQRDGTGAQSLGSTAYPWGSLKVNQEAELVEVDAGSHTVTASVAWKNLRKFLFLKDAPSSYSSYGGQAVRVKVDETGLEFGSLSSLQLFTSSGTFTAPAGCTMVLLTMLGGGGGGGTGNNPGSAGSGGGAGAFLHQYPYFVTPTTSYTVTIGAGGATDSAGGNTTFDTVVVANGGTGGSNGGGATAGGATTLPSGLSATGITPVTGKIGAGIAGGNGGASSAETSGGGGSTYFGTGGTGYNAVADSGVAPTGYGSGGYGGSGNNHTKSGSAGRPGFLIIQY